MLSSPKNIWQKQEKEVCTVKWLKEGKNLHQALYLFYLWFFPHTRSSQAYKLTLRNRTKGQINKYVLLDALGLILQAALRLQSLLKSWGTEALTLKRSEYLARSDCWYCLQGAHISRVRSKPSLSLFLFPAPISFKGLGRFKKTLLISTVLYKNKANE